MPNTTLLDGQFSRGIYVGRARLRRPFQVNADRSATVIDRDWRIREKDYIPGSVGIEADPTLPRAYLMAESDPAPTGISDVLATTRTFATIPADQITYGSRVITKPSPSTLGTAINLQLVTGAGTSNNLGANYQYNSHIWDGVNRRVYGPQVAVTDAVSGGDCRITWTAHGLAGTERLALGTASSTHYLFAAGQYTIVDANRIDLTGWVSLAGGINAAQKYLRDYTSGSDRVGLRLTQKFYLPGITAGITSPTDIPLPDVLLNDASLLSALTTYLTGYQTYDATELIRWNDWPIYTQTLIEINMADL